LCSLLKIGWQTDPAEQNHGQSNAGPNLIRDWITL
jgi:hypothetical protein